MTAAVLVLGLTGCTATEVAAPSPTTSRSAEAPVATPTPTPTTEPDLTAVVLSATELILVDEQGDTAALLDFHSADPAAFAEALSAAAGVDAVETTTPGGFEGAEFTTEYEWDGLLISRSYSDECLPQCQSVYLSVDGSHVAGIPIRTASGISVGDSLAEAQALGAQQTPNGWAAEPEDPALIDSESNPTRIVVLNLDEADAAIASLLASGWFLSYGGI
ncbi:hypothetical protein ASD93_03625 [Microbacterium sp. Root180]|nr:hypothetical protein ASD93_03625 [Microbacterium sp. Root180]